MHIALFGLYAYDRSGKVRWLLEEMGLAYEDRWLDPKTREHEQVAYLKINPLGRVPSVLIDDRPMIESSAICLFLADLFPEKSLAPALSAPGRQEFLQWLFFASTLEAFATRIGIIEDIPAGDVFDQNSRSLQNDVHDAFAFLDQALSRNEYVAGNFSAADISIGYHLYFASLWPEFKPALEAHPRVREYLARLKARPAAKKSAVFSYEE